MALVYLVFFIFIFAVLSHFAKTEKFVFCPLHSINSKSHRTGWGPEVIYAVKVCLKINWKVKADCTELSNSHFVLKIKHSSGIEEIRTNFTPTDGLHFCEIYDPCRIAKALQGKNIAVADVSASFYVYAFPGREEGLSYDIYFKTNPMVLFKDKERKLAKQHEFISVLCYFPKCTINSKGYGGNAKYYFKKSKKNQAPLCVEKDASTFSVTQFVCDPKCSPRYYNAVAADKDIPPKLPTTKTKDTKTPTNGDKVTPKTPTNGDKVFPKTLPSVDTVAPTKAAAATTTASNAFCHLSIRTILIVAVLALLA